MRTGKTARSLLAVDLTTRRCRSAKRVFLYGRLGPTWKGCEVPGFSKDDPVDDLLGVDFQLTKEPLLPVSLRVTPEAENNPAGLVLLASKASFSS